MSMPRTRTSGISLSFATPPASLTPLRATVTRFIAESIFDTLNMYGSVLFTSLFAAMVAADATTVLQGLSNLTTSLIELDKDVNATQPGLGLTYQALQVEVDSVTVDNNILASISQVQASAPFSLSESQQIIASVNNLTSSAVQALTDINGKRSAIAGLYPVVLEALYQLQEDQQTLGDALSPKLDPSVVLQGVADLTKVQAAFAESITIYGGN